MLKTEMKKNAMLLLLCVLSVVTSIGQTLKVGTYNMRYDNPADVESGNSWKTRRDVVCSIISYENPAIFGAQEVLHHQLGDVCRLLPDYGFIGVGREDGKTVGEYAPIFYNKVEVELLDNGHFWLSQTPDRPSLGWDAACTRICTWGRFRLKSSGRQVMFFNFHADHVGIIARRKAAEMVVDSIRAKAEGCQVVVTGDFNVDQHNEIYNVFTASGVLDDSFVTASHRLATNGTFNGYDTAMHTDSRIDHIMVTKGSDVERIGVLTIAYWTKDAEAEKQKGHDAPAEIGLQKQTLRFPSDHFPVMAVLRLK